MKTIRLSQNPCPWCGYEIDSHTDAVGIASPSPGDVSVCLSCGGLLQFSKKLALQKLEGNELAQVMLVDPKAYASLVKAQDVVMKRKGQ